MGNLTLEDVNNMYLDVLKEIGNIGAGNATTAIANMLGMKIDMNVPNVKLMEVSKLGTAVGAEDETIVGIFLEVMNDIEGSMMFLVDMAASILSVPAIEFGQFGDNALLIQTEICADVAINGYFILMPEQGSYEKILTSLGISL